MKHKAILAISVVSFLIFTVVAFVLQSSKPSSDIENSGLNNGGVMKGNQTDSASNEEKNEQNKKAEELVIQDFSSKLERNGNVLEWSVPFQANLESLSLLRTPSNPAGGAFSYDVLNSNGKFVDSSMKPGIIYFYELSGKTRTGTVYSKMVANALDVNVKFRAAEPYMTLNGEQVSYDKNRPISPYDLNGVLMVPAKATVEALGGRMEPIMTEVSKSAESSSVNSVELKSFDFTKLFKSEKNSNQGPKVESKATVPTNTFLIAFGANEVEVTPGMATVKFNRKETTVEGAPILNNETLFIPIGIIRDTFGAKISSSNNEWTVEKQSFPEVVKGLKEEAKMMDQKEGEPFQITLEKKKEEQERWFYVINEPGPMEFRGRVVHKNIDGSMKVDLTFVGLKKGTYTLSFFHFVPDRGLDFSPKKLSFHVQVN